MDDSDPRPDWAKDLAARARARLELEGGQLDDASAGDLRELVHTLRTQHVELELQNEELRRAQRALSESRDRYARLYDAAPVGYLTLDEEGLLLEANRTASRVLGLSRGELVGRPAAALVHPDGQDEIFRHLRGLAAAAQLRRCEVRVADSEGREQWVRFESTASTDDQGRPTVLCALSDVTAERLAAAEQARLEARLSEASKHEALGVLAGGVAHDFNNILVAVLGNAALARMDLPAGSPAAETIGKIEVAAGRAAELSGRMLDYSGKGKLVVEPVDLGAVAQETASLLASVMPRSVRLVLDLAEGLPRVVADATQMRQLVLNLITNALEAVGEGDGTVRVRTAALPASTDEGESAGAQVVLEVRDDGPGMDEATRERLFEPFFSTKLAGRGLGLAAVHGIVRGHEGSITVESAPGQGACFTVTLLAREPQRQPEAREAQVATPAPSPAPAGKGKVLVIDDEAIVVDVARAVLERAGYEVITAPDGRAGLAAFEEQHEELLCVLLDLTMPDLGGEAVLEEIHRIQPEARVLLMSGFSAEETLSRPELSGISGFVQKPFTTKTLAAAMERLRARGRESAE